MIPGLHCLPMAIRWYSQEIMMRSHCDQPQYFKVIYIKTNRIMNNNIDPTINVQNIISEAVDHLDDLRKAEMRRLDDLRDVDLKHIDEKFKESDLKYQIQFSDSEKAVVTAFIAQEKAISTALIGTKEAINKSDTNTDKRFDLISEKIDSMAQVMSKNSGEQSIYVTHNDLQYSLERLQTNIESTLRP